MAPLAMSTKPMAPSLRSRRSASFARTTCTSRSPSASKSTSVAARCCPVAASAPAVTAAKGPSVYTPWKTALPPTAMTCSCGPVGVVQYGEGSHVIV